MQEITNMDKLMMIILLFSGIVIIFTITGIIVNQFLRNPEVDETPENEDIEKGDCL